MAVSDAQKKAAREYQKKLVQINIRVKPEYADMVKARADSKGLPLRAYIISLIDQDLKTE